MPNPSTNHLKLHVEETKDVLTAIDIPGWADFQTSLEGLTGRKLEVVPAFQIPNASPPIAELPGLFGDDAGYLIDNSAACVGKGQAATKGSADGAPTSRRKSKSQRADGPQDDYHRLAASIGGHFG